MNRQKKIKQINKKKLKRANQKKAPKKKSTYISKADRAAMEAEENQQNHLEGSTEAMADHLSDLDN